ncbi:DUF1217 domain-containing protein [Rhodovulum sp. DZ06]|uniref:DUF1217 domain-containing protein n=1 Tax=Rhodovulum sp. DZ06 TaxID=3425126 RepID=UPI003D35667A
MSFQPSVPLSGIGGWKLLQRTEATQRAAFETSPQIARDIQYFKDNIASADTAEKLVSDPRLLKVALGAFGLEEEAFKKALIQRALEDGSTDPNSIAVKMVDPRWKRFSAGFGYGDLLGAKTGYIGFGDKIAKQYLDRQFDLAVGESDDSLRLALNFRREISRYANGAQPDGYTWFEALGDRPVRAVLEKAFGLPTEFGKLDIDRQRDEMKDRMRDMSGTSSLAGFNDPEVVEKALTRFLARTAAESGPNATTRGMAALTMLQSGGVGAGASAGLLLSNAG